MQGLLCEESYTSIRMDKGKSRQVNDEPDACTCDSGYSSPAHSSTSSSSTPGLSYSSDSLSGLDDSQEGSFRAALFDDGEDDWNHTPSCCDESRLSRDRRKALPRTFPSSHPLAASSDEEDCPCEASPQSSPSTTRTKRKWSDWWKGLSSWDRRDRQKPDKENSESHPVACVPEQEDIIRSMVEMQAMPIISPDLPSSLSDSWDDSCTDNCHLEEAPGYTQPSRTPYRILVNTDLYLMSALENVMMDRRKIRAPLKQRGYVERPWQCSVASPLRQVHCVA